MQVNFHVAPPRSARRARQSAVHVPMSRGPALPRCFPKLQANFHVAPPRGARRARQSAVHVHISRGPARNHAAASLCAYIRARTARAANSALRQMPPRWSLRRSAGQADAAFGYFGMATTDAPQAFIRPPPRHLRAAPPRRRHLCAGTPDRSASRAPRPWRTSCAATRRPAPPPGTACACP